MSAHRSRWHTSNRRGRLPSNWESIRHQVAQRANYKCQATQHAPECNGIGTDCDHITPGDNHNLDNLQWLSAACHKAKTARESAERNHQYKTMKTHPKEPHPSGITLGGDSPTHLTQPPDSTSDYACDFKPVFHRCKKVDG